MGTERPSAGFQLSLLASKRSDLKPQPLALPQVCGPGVQVRLTGASEGCSRSQAGWAHLLLSSHERPDFLVAAVG